MSDAKTVAVGDREYTIGGFSTYKALRVGDAVDSIMQAVPDLTERVGRFTREWSAENTQKITRAAAELRYPAEDVQRISEEAWKANGGVLELPAAPSPFDVAAHVFPFVFQQAKEQVLPLLALLCATNSDLREWDESGGEAKVDEELGRLGRRILHEPLDELLELVIVSAEVIGEQFAGKMDRLRNVPVLLGFRPGSTPESQEAETTEPGDSTSATSSPSTSTDSGASTDGPVASLSTESPSTALSGSSV